MGMPYEGCYDVDCQLDDEKDIGCDGCEVFNRILAKADMLYEESREADNG